MPAKMNFEKVTACRELYFKHCGTEHKLIAKLMRENGWTDFSRRVFYRRGNRPGWPELYGWDLELRDDETAGRSDTGKRRRKGRPGSGFANRRDKQSTLPGNAGALACIDAKASGKLGEETTQTEPRTSADSAEVVNNDAPHAGGTGVAGKGACGPGEAASLRPGVSPSQCLAFHAWLKTLPGIWHWDWRHQLYLYERLQRVTDGECKRLMVFMPPRHGKSELVTVRYTAWRMLRDPSMNVILAGYNQKLANRFSRKIRRVLCESVASISTAETQSRGDENTSETREIGNRQVINRSQPSSSPRLSDSAVNEILSLSTMFPFTKQRCANSVAEWETAIGGGLRAVGVGGGVTGYGAQLIMIDDPVKNRAQAESATFRDGVWNWYNDDLYTRLEPGGSIILIQTRWHEDDLAGRLLREMKNGGEQWEIVDLPALAKGIFTAETQRRGEEKPFEDKDSDLSQGNDDTKSPDVLPQRLSDSAVQTYADPSEIAKEIFTAETPRRRDEKPFDEMDINLPSGSEVKNSSEVLSQRLSDSAVQTYADPLNREPGEALCRERFDETALARIKTQLGTYSFSALYQQHPVPAEGATFKRAWFRNIIDAAPPGLRWFRGYDLAVSTKTSADYTASFRVAQDKDGNVYIADGFRARIEYPEQRKYIIERITTERNTSHGIEASLHGQALVQELRRDNRLSGRPFKAVRVDTDKLTRALSWANTAEEGKILLVNGAWIQDFLEEVLTFPSGKHDDQIDAVSIAIRMIAEVGTNKGWGIQRL